MRKVIGGVALIAGVGGLSYWGSQDQAETMQSLVTQRAAEAVSGSVHRAEASVVGRDITLTGLADTAAERDAMLAALDEVEGRRIVRDETEILPALSPFVTEGALTPDGERLLKGAVPTEAARAALGDRAGDLELASGAPAGWSAMAESAEAALDQLARGKWRLVDGVLTLSGVARSEDDKTAAVDLLTDLPGEASAEIDVIPLIEPFNTTGILDSTGQLSLAGFVPGPEQREVLGAAASDLSRADGAPDDWLTLVSAGQQSLSFLAEGEFALSNRDLRVTGKARSAEDRDMALAVLDALENETGAKAASDIIVVPLIDNFLTEGSKPSGGAVSYSGYVPSDYARSLLGDGAGALVLADGADPEWEALAPAGAAALSALDSGSWTLEGARLSVTGIARTKEAQDFALAAVEGLADPDDVSVELVPLMAPFTTSGDKVLDGDVALSGFAPRPLADDLGLTRADGAPENWQRLTEGALGALENLAEGNFALSDRDLMVAGKARDAESRDAALAALNDIGSVNLMTEITVIPLISPFVTEAVKAPGGTPQLSGFAPATYGIELFGDAGATLELADGAPGNWEALAEAGNAALAPLHQGQWLLEDDALVLTGVARSQADRDAALAELAETPNATADITVIPEVSPYVTAGTFAADGEESLTGHAPDAQALQELGAAGTAVALGVGAPEDWGTAVAAARKAMQPLDRGSWELSDRQLVLRGVARTEDAADQSSAAVADLNGFAIRNEIETIALIEPFVTGARREEGGALAYTGFAPVGADLSNWGDAAADLPTAEGAPEDWNALTQAGSDALAALASGGWSVEGSSLRVTGIARSQDQLDAANAAIAGLGDAATLDAALEPPRFAVTIGAGEGGKVDGLLPGGLGKADLAGAIGLADLAGDANATEFGDAQAALDAVGALKPWLGQLESAKIDVVEGVAAIEAQVVPGADPDFVKAGLLEAYPGAALSVGTAQKPADGTLRRNALTGAEERAVAGFWLPVVDFSPTIDSCPVQSDKALAQSQIQFVTGSANLSPRSLAAINRMASVIRPCILQGGLVAELGGHTDSQGAEEANYALSLARAEAVRAALVSRGVPVRSISAVGYGETQPIADNETEEGRAMNRRTTITWAAGPEVAPEE
ncbi:OmpA family protein [Thalassococcus lentus]|uniref:OmpA family protein n=1 Tax=Thalassococcus lentus TaxID=1210524 RepID=A0ABT4XTL9_9RHOB|nr:OmpA family protein [Thalassococcus lentus]MDA7425295.1 OmpA family protein [Thalassococcus lentus]